MQIVAEICLLGNEESNITHLVDGDAATNEAGYPDTCRPDHNCAELFPSVPEEGLVDLIGTKCGQKDCKDNRSWLVRVVGVQ